MNNSRIESSQNERLKSWRKLKKRKERLKSGTMIVEGEQLIKEATRSGVTIKAILHTEKKKEYVHQFIYKRYKDVPIYELTDALFHLIVDTEQPQGIAAEVSLPRYVQEDLLRTYPATHLMIDRIQDPGNLGAIFRTAEALGVTALWLEKGTVDPFKPKVVRAAMGSLFRVPFVICELQEQISVLKDKQFALYATDPHDGQLLHQVQFPRNVVMMLGNEAQGLATELQQQATETICVPMTGETESLNVSTATGILLYERLRQGLSE